METRPEIKSLPRNRKCGNCRYFEPAPLWRKGWCRNPRLYDRRANHLVDASSIDCEQVFRARIYWEPIPSVDDFGGAAADGGVMPAADTAAFSPQPPAPTRDPFAPTLGYSPLSSSDTYKQVNAPASTYTQPRPGPVPTNVTEVRQQAAAMPQAPQQVAPPPRQPQAAPVAPQSQPQQQANLPQINRVGTGVAGGSRGVGPAWRNKDRERAPQIKPKNYPGQARKWLVENVPYYNKIDEPLSRIPASTLIMGGVVVLLVLALLVFQLRNGSNKGTTSTTAISATSGVADLMATGVPSSGATNYSLVPPTATIANVNAPAIGTAAAPATAAAGTQAPAGSAPAPANTPAVAKKGIVTSVDGMRIRDKPSSTGAQLSIVKVGEIITIGTDAPIKDGDNSWYPVEYKGIKGWARSDLFKLQ